MAILDRNFNRMFNSRQISTLRSLSTSAYFGFFEASLAKRSAHSRRRTIGSYRRLGKWVVGLGIGSYTGFRMASWWNQDDLWVTRRVIYGNRGGFVDVPASIRISENFSKNSKFITIISKLNKFSFQMYAILETSEDDDMYTCIQFDSANSTSSANATSRPINCFEPAERDEGGDDDDELWHGVCCEDVSKNVDSVCCYATFSSQPSTIKSVLQ